MRTTAWWIEAAGLPDEGSLMDNVLRMLNQEYVDHVDRLLAAHDEATAMSLAVGGEWEAIGAVEVGILRRSGFTVSDSLLDIGCGSGRLATSLRAWGHKGGYLGADVVPALVKYARRTVPGYRFEVIDGLDLPASAEPFDFACFFSVLTHLPFEASFLLLQAAVAELRPGGRVVASFLEFADPGHWAVWDGSVASFRSARHHNQFIHRDDLAVLGERAGLRVVEICGGHDSEVEIVGEYTWSDGRPLTSPAKLGQSWMVFEKT
jgi:SAM-dependent methyltransferase